MAIPAYAVLLNLTLQTLKQLDEATPAVRLEQEIVARLSLTAGEVVVVRPQLARARRDLKASGLLDTPARGRWEVTAAGREAESVDEAAVRQAANRQRRRTRQSQPVTAPMPPPTGVPPAARARMLAPALRPSVISEALDPEFRDELDLPHGDGTRMPVVIELNIRHEQGLEGAITRFRALYAAVYPDAPAPLLIGDTYFRCDLTMNEVRVLVQRDETDGGEAPRRRAIFRVWPDFPIGRLTDRSVATVKGDAALRAYNASGTDIVWAVIDSGIDGAHPHFHTFDTLGGDVAQLHRDFTLAADAPLDAQVSGALTDDFGHGTHVAGIIAGGLPPRPSGPDGKNLDTFRVGQRLTSTDATTPAEEVSSREAIKEREVGDQGRLTGVAPQCKLVSLKVLDKRGESRSTDVIRALQYVRESVNASRRIPRIHGVNLSVGYGFNPKWFACGQSPICIEVDKLVRSGVVVVVAAGNTGFNQFTTASGPTMTIGMAQTINDPGNADLAITVGSTHRDSPHTYGVSYFSSKGPTGDGRLKPNLVAPGERVTSCAAGKMREKLGELYGNAIPEGAAAYIDDSGTSMAAPHVSGVVAAFLSIRREFIGQPERVKRLLLDNATSLGRDRNFEGHGLVDLMRTIQAV